MGLTTEGITLPVFPDRLLLGATGMEDCVGDTVGAGVGGGEDGGGGVTVLECTETV